ncbi:monovalent cation:proton antiporter-2 (CPA2) family protein [Ferruginivarius sediminum]|uniref:Potassium transporter KefB n=1 Tax=Ferruginivarius sediminum TaxID=2661937 RepID=A0A369TAM9_9PROT|nr:monovalent cation:proton antiporter-2 (CPA2) family protein [Ferruginivarius sediminum]RDD61932.1 potassium transporter KefB [Ferruginivarius sediminum]
MQNAGHLNDVLVVLLAAIVSVPLVQRLRVSPVLGYLVAGVVIGPHALGLIHDLEGTEILAEFGVIFLLFAIGLDLPLRRLVAMRRYIFGLGLAQVFLTSLAIGAIAYAAGLPPETALVVGGALALSSTATVLQLLVERREVAERHGRMSVAVLLFQDLAVVPLLALLPILAGGSRDIVSALGLAGVKALVAIAVILIVGRLLLRPVYAVMAETRNAEIFAATNLFLVLLTGWATAQAGMSMALGAFLAGLMLADTEYRHQIEADIQPFRGLFLGLFFMTVGMGVDLGLIVADAAAVFGLAGALLAGKAALLFVLLLVGGNGAGLAARVALLLAQGGEFAFVVFGLAMQQGILERGIGQTLVAAVAISMASTPLFAELGKRIAARGERPKATPEALTKATGDIENHVLVAGFGRVGWTVCKLLERSEIPYVALDVDMDRVQSGREQNMPVYFGDASRIEVLRAAGLERARSAVITLDQPRLAEQAVAVLRSYDRNLPVVSRARDIDHRKRLEEMGASAVVSEALEASLQLGAKVLRLTGTAGEQVEQALDEFRRDDYAILSALPGREGEDGEPGPGRFAGWLSRHLHLRRNRGGKGT